MIIIIFFLFLYFQIVYLFTLKDEIKDSHIARKLVFGLLDATLDAELATKFSFFKKIKNSKKMIFSDYEFVKVIEGKK